MIFVNTPSQYMVEPRHVHLVAAKHVMRYIKGTLDYGLRYASNGEIRLHGFPDSYWEGSVEDRKSTLGCCFSLGLGMISLFNRKKTNIALNTTEAEYIAACLACSEVVWFRKVLEILFNT